MCFFKTIIPIFMFDILRYISTSLFLLNSFLCLAQVGTIDTLHSSKHADSSLVYTKTISHSIRVDSLLFTIDNNDLLAVKRLVVEDGAMYKGNKLDYYFRDSISSYSTLPDRKDTVLQTTRTWFDSTSSPESPILVQEEYSARVRYNTLIFLARKHYHQFKNDLRQLTEAQDLNLDPIPFYDCYPAHIQKVFFTEYDFLKAFHEFNFVVATFTITKENSIASLDYTVLFVKKE